MSEYHLGFDQLHGVSTARASAILKSKIGLVAEIRSVLNSLNLDANELCVFHCIIYQQKLCAKLIKFTHVTCKAVTCVTIIKSRALNQHQFHHFLEDIKVEYVNLIHFFEVWWLIKGKKFKQFPGNKRYEVPEFMSDDWVHVFAFLMDLTFYLNKLHLRLQL
jgi:hypothetical protein